MQQTMKSNIKTTLLALTCATILLFSSSCKDSTVATGKLSFHMHTNIDTSEVDSLGKYFKDATGRQVSLSRAQFYFSNVSFTKADGTKFTMTGNYYLKRYENEVNLIGAVPAGDYTTVNFDLGVDAAANAIAPTGHTGQLDSVLSMTNIDMWNGTTALGYMFMDAEGIVDYQGTPTGFNYKISSNTSLRTITLTGKTITVLPNKDNLVHLTCDYGALIKGVTISPGVNQYANNPTITTKLANAFQGMFRYEM
jgi:hypothetical protein